MKKWHLKQTSEFRFSGAVINRPNSTTVHVPPGIGRGGEFVVEDAENPDPQHFEELVEPAPAAAAETPKPPKSGSVKETKAAAEEAD